MKKYCGTLHQVTEPEFLKQFGQGLTIDTIRIGNKTLRKVKIFSETALFLKPDEKREVCLYVFYLLFTPNILGMKYTDTGDKHLVPGSFILGSFIRYAVICSIVFH